MYLTKDIHFKSLQLLSSPHPYIQAHEVSNPRVIREFQIGNQTTVHRRYRYNTYEHDEETNEETTEKVVFFLKMIFKLNNRDANSLISFQEEKS